MKIAIPSYVKKALSMLSQKGEAYIVGGCVRDSLLGFNPTDYDITTSLTPDEVKSIFHKHPIIKSTGEKHGTVSVIIDGKILEITTFRTESKYLDGRHPSSVSFAKSLSEDLSRRDFTINAMAYNDESGIIDMFNGIRDLKLGIVRTVGNPFERFSEDYLRMLRAIRFAGRFNFKIEEETSKAIKELAGNLDKISKERILAELREILVGKNIKDTLIEYKNVFTTIIKELLPAVDFDQKNKWHAHDVYTHTSYVVSYTRPDFVTRMAALLHDIGKSHSCQEEIVDGKTIRHFRGHPEVSYTMSIPILKNLRVSNKESKEILFLVRNHDCPMQANKKAIKKVLIETPNNDLDLFSKLLDIKRADDLDHIILELPPFNRYFQIAKEIIDSHEVLGINDLAIDGNDLKEIGFEGEDIGKALNRLLESTIDGNLSNDKKSLLEYAMRLKD